MLNLIPDKVYAIVAAALVLTGGVVLHYLEVTHLKTELAQREGQIAKLQGLNAALQSTNETYAALTAQQNQAVQAMSDLSRARQDKAQAEIAVVTAQSARVLATATDLLHRSMPKPGDACGSLDILLNQAIQARKP
ncbi:hypothetical protein PQ43W_18 [Ralstonia phage PQ43W]